MKNLVLSKFGNVIATDEKSLEVYNFINDAIKDNEIVKIDAKNVTISTKSSRLIFGKLYKQLTSKTFWRKSLLKMLLQYSCFLSTKEFLQKLK